MRILSIPVFTLLLLATISIIAQASESDYRVTDAAKRKGEQQHQKQLDIVKGLVQESEIIHSDHRRKGEQQHLVVISRTFS